MGQQHISASEWHAGRKKQAIAAFYQPVISATALKDSVCMQTYSNILHVYGLHTAKDAVLPLFESTLGQLRRIDVYLQHSTALEQSGAHAVDLVCDSRSILIGFSDGTFQLLSWQSQVHGGPSLPVDVLHGQCQSLPHPG